MGKIGATVVLGICLVLFWGCGPGRGRSVHEPVRDPDVRVVVGFSEIDISIMRDYFRHHRLPPGLAKRSQLPPGLRKQLVRRGTLPPGLAGDLLPYDLERRLEPLPVGYVRIRVGMDIVLLEERTGIIIDVVRDVVR